MKTPPELERKGLKRRRRICARTRCRKEDGKVGYDMSGMLYDPIFQITFRAPCHRRADPLLFRFSLALCSTSVIPFSFLMSLSSPPSLFLPFVLLNLARTYILHGLYLHTAKSFAWFHEGSSIPELKFKGGAAVRAVCFTRRESIIFYVRCAAQVRSIPFVLLPESPWEPSAGCLPDFPPFAFALCSSFVPSSVWFSFNLCMHTLFWVQNSCWCN